MRSVQDLQRDPTYAWGVGNNLCYIGKGSEDEPAPGDPPIIFHLLSVNAAPLLNTAWGFAGFAGKPSFQQR
jgi:hypothetical protein